MCAPYLWPSQQKQTSTRGKWCHPSRELKIENYKEGVTRTTIRWIRDHDWWGHASSLCTYRDGMVLWSVFQSAGWCGGMFWKLEKNVLLQSIYSAPPLHDRLLVKFIMCTFVWLKRLLCFFSIRNARSVTRSLFCLSKFIRRFRTSLCSLLYHPTRCVFFV